MESQLAKIDTFKRSLKYSVTVRITPDSLGYANNCCRIKKQFERNGYVLRNLLQQPGQMKEKHVTMTPLCFTSVKLNSVCYYLILSVETQVKYRSLGASVFFFLSGYYQCRIKLARDP